MLARPARDILQADRQQITRDWCDFKRGEHDLFISQVALDETAFGDTEMVRLRWDLVQDVPLLESTGGVRESARELRLAKDKDNIGQG